MTRQKSLMSPVKHKAHSYPMPTRTLREVIVPMDRAEERAGPEDVGEQALMRGLDTAFPFIRLGLSLSKVGRRSMIGPASLAQSAAPRTCTMCWPQRSLRRVFARHRRHGCRRWRTAHAAGFHAAGFGPLDRRGRSKAAVAQSDHSPPDR